MAEETKTYSIVGSVTIGSDEYRELITDYVKADTELSEYRSKYWAEQTKSNALAKERDELAAYKALVTKFFEDNEAAKSSFVQWRLERNM